MHSDSAFYMGKTHQVCQDFSYSDSVRLHNYTCPYTIISDGCSSSTHTDIGSRILVAETNKLMKDDVVWTKTLQKYQQVIFNSAQLVSNWRLPTTCLDATLLALSTYPLQDEQFGYEFFCAGDGCLIKIKHDGEIEVTEIEYTSNAPFYLSYLLDADRRLRYIEKFGLEKTVQRYTLGAEGPQNLTQTTIHNDVCINEQPHRTLISDHYFVERDSATEYKVLACVSDGILRFSNDSEFVDSWKVLKKLLQFKQFTGSFVQRRLNRFLKDTPSFEWEYHDDVSMGAIYLGS